MTDQPTHQFDGAAGETIQFGMWTCDASGRDWADLVHPEDADATMESWRTCVANGATWRREHRVRRPGGKYGPILSQAIPLSDAGEVARWVGFDLDVGRFREVEHLLRDSDRRGDRFLSMLAHELRNPLVPIRNGLHLMQVAGLSTAAQRDAHQVMVRQVENLVRLVSDMLDLGRISQRKLVLRRRRIGLVEIIDTAVDMARPHIDESSHELHLLMPDEAISVVADPERMTQVIANLLINSATYTPHGGSIELRARRLTGEVEVTVTDHGATLPDLRRSVTDAIERNDQTPRFTENLGVGLTLIKELVEMHGGMVVSTRDETGDGGTLGIRFPIDEAQNSPTDELSRA